MNAATCIKRSEYSEYKNAIWEPVHLPFLTPKTRQLFVLHHDQLVSADCSTNVEGLVIFFLYSPLVQVTETQNLFVWRNNLITSEITSDLEMWNKPVVWIVPAELYVRSADPLLQPRLGHF